MDQAYFPFALSPELLVDFPKLEELFVVLFFPPQSDLNLKSELRNSSIGSAPSAVFIHLENLRKMFFNTIKLLSLFHVSVICITVHSESLTKGLFMA